MRDETETFDSLGRLLELTYPDGEILRHSDDAGGNLAAVTGSSVRSAGVDPR